jgi:nucleoside triphosphate diphosphatase
VTHESDNPIFKLWEVIDTLLGPDGCPWDKQQTPESLCDYILEEAHELVDAVRRNDLEEAKEELGDILFLLLFVGRLYRDRGSFTAEQAMESIIAKMIRRHPHVFGGQATPEREQHLQNWEQIKREEKKEKGDATKQGTFSSLPAELPPMLKAYRINSKAARTGFTWDSDEEVERQLDDEWREWREAVSSGDQDKMEAEFGDCLFTMVELGRRKGLKANAALHRANIKFLDRFEQMEALARERGQEVADLNLDEQNALWDEVKEKE